MVNAKVQQLQPEKVILDKGSNSLQSCQLAIWESGVGCRGGREWVPVAAKRPPAGAGSVVCSTLFPGVSFPRAMRPTRVLKERLPELTGSRWVWAAQGRPWGMVHCATQIPQMLRRSILPLQLKTAVCPSSCPGHQAVNTQCLDDTGVKMPGPLTPIQDIFNGPHQQGWLSLCCDCTNFSICPIFPNRCWPLQYSLINFLHNNLCLKTLLPREPSLLQRVIKKHGDS